MSEHDLRTFLAENDVPESFSFRSTSQDPLGDHPVRLRGAVQAGSRESLFVLVGAVVLEVPADAIVSLSRVHDEPGITVDLDVLPGAIVESRSQFIIVPDDVEALPAALGDRAVEFSIVPDPRIRHNRKLLAKLSRIGVPLPVRWDDQGSETFSYLSSATVGGDGGTDSDPIRVADDHN